MKKSLKKGNKKKILATEIQEISLKHKTKNSWLGNHQNTHTHQRHDFQNHKKKVGTELKACVNY